MTKNESHLLDTAFLRAETPMFSDVMQRVQNDETLSETRRRDLLSGLSRVAKALNRAPQSLPADPKWLQPRLSAISPAALRLSAKSWSNAVSDARAALVRCTIVERRIAHVDDLSPEWRKLWQCVLASRDLGLQPPLRRFVYFLSRQGVSPKEACEEQALAYRDALRLNEISKSPEVSYRHAVYAWNRAVGALPEWPRQRLALPSRVRRVSLPLEAFPESFQSDLDRFVASLERPDLLDPLARVAPLRPATIREYRHGLVRFASALVEVGTPAEQIDRISHLVQPQQAERGLRHLLAKNGHQTSATISHVAHLLRISAKQYVRVGEEHQKTLDRMARRLALKRQNGMTAKNRERLRALEDRATLRRLLLLPQQLVDRADRARTAYPTDLAREDAIAIAILLYCPIRRHNLAGINIDRNFQRPGDGRVFLVFEPNEVKNQKRIEFELPSSVVKMIDRHLATRAPRLCPPGTPWLFPKRDGTRPMHPDQLSDRVKRRIRREIGLTMNMHLFRHLAAMLWLEAHPGAYEAVRRLLGHSSLSRTLNAYAGCEAGTATRLFSKVIDDARNR